LPALSAEQANNKILEVKTIEKKVNRARPYAYSFRVSEEEKNSLTIKLKQADWTIGNRQKKEKREDSFKEKFFMWGGYYYAREKKLCSNWLGVKRPSEECGRREL